MRELTVARTLKWLMAFQLVIGLALVAGDLGGAWPSLPFSTPDAPEMQTPVRPGDQTRRYEPTEVSNPGDRRDLPRTGELPDRLTMRTEGATLLVTGKIAEGDAERFTDTLSGATGIDTVALLSSGGSVMDALEIGRAIRSAGLATEVQEGGVCLSACPYILASGTERRVPESARVGVHQHYFGENVILPAFMAVNDMQRGLSRVMAYLSEMGVDPLVMEHGLETPPDEIYILVPEEMTRYRLVTG